ncbi:MAG: hypothetical protein RIF41_12905 [Polyangiaceae bacterium]
MKVAQTAVAMILGIVLPLLVQLWDKRRLDDEARARSWNFATWGGALYAFGPLSMLGWSWVTRPFWWRVLMGPLWVFLMIAFTSTVPHVMEVAATGTAKGNLTDGLVLGAFIGGIGFILLLLMELLYALWRLGRWLLRWWRARRADKAAG